MGKDPGGRLGSIAVHGRNRKQLKLRGSVMREHGWQGSPRGSLQHFLGKGAHGSVAESGWRPEPTPHAYRGGRRTGQALCYAVEHTVSPVRVLSQLPPSSQLPASAGLG